MSDSNGSVYGLAIFLLTMNIVIPIFTYSLSDISLDQDFTNSIRYLDQDSLIDSGIYIDQQERYNITLGQVIEFVNTSQVLRVYWDDPAVWPNFQFYTNRGPVVLGDWPFKNFQRVWIGGELYTYGLIGAELITNQTIISNFDTDRNWTRASLPDIGAEAFFTCEAYDNNITEAILDQGLVNITIGTAVDFAEVDHTKFMAWYWGLLTNTSTYNLPASIAWIFRIQAILLIFTSIIIARDLTRI